MNVKERTIPLRILKDEALLRNISPQNPAYSEIESDYYRRKAGYWGETQIDYYLRLLPQQDKYYILNDLRLPFKGYFFQIDSLIVTTRYCLVIESKNIKGTLFFDGVFDQLIRINDDTEEAFEDPITQAKNIILQLKEILIELIPSLPFDYIVSIASHKTILKTDAKTMKRVFHASSLVQKIIELDGYYTDEVIKIDDIEEVCNFLLKLHSPAQQNIAEIYRLTERDILKGVLCGKCRGKMVFVKYRWVCCQCDHCSQDAHLQKLMDYLLIFRPFITNKQLRTFLEIPSRRVANRILKNSGLTWSGEGKARVYFAPTSLIPNNILFAEGEQDEI
ncbi:nuclease-related domain-containing protein [Bacillus sp. FJAT-27245]|uniref:nuclease-related domain-containing protein n=1 Tax=Bacillus sp. FJAT-27245 TaxID=1684144 RepID=UPI0006A7BE00|nr:nuclease-related domain-containing protein [Bacillus sp. FJAT-27245]